MKRAYVLLFPIAIMLNGTVALADVQVPLSVTLVKPSDQSFLNLESCQNPATVELEISWKLEQQDLWDVTEDADVFLAADDTCASPQVEIGKAEADGADITIAVNQTQGQFPDENNDLYLSDISGLSCTTASEHDYYLCIRWEYEYNNGITTTNYIYRGGAPIRFDTKAPGAPTLTQVQPGENNLKVTWEEPSDDDIDDFIVYYRAEGSGETKSTRVTDPAATSRQITGLENGIAYEVWITAVDVADNEGAASETVTGTPEPVEDFYEHYRNAGGREDGGFCFVATAAFGSYLNPQVAKLRSFRDGVLEQSAVGRELVRDYYRYGPRWARAIRNSDSLRALTRIWLAPVALATTAWQTIGGWALFGLVLAGGAGVPLLLRRRRRSRTPRNLDNEARSAQPMGGPPPARSDSEHRRGSPASSGTVPGLFVLTAGLVLHAVPSRSLAQESEETVGMETVQPRFQFQTRFGFYRPAIDSEADLTGEPFREIFGGGSQFLFELGLDWEFFHFFGPISAGGSVGFVQYLGKALTGSGAKSSDTNVLNLLPLRLNVSYTFDGLWTWWGLPFLPYVSGGFDYYIWWVLDGVGDVARFEDADGNISKARGGIFGGHFSAGMKMLLDALDREAAGNLQAQTGIINSYLFVEYAMSWIDSFGSGSHMNLGDSTVMFGLMMEF